VCDHFVVRPQPELRQFEDGLAGLGDGGRAHRLRARQCGVLAQVAAVGRRQQPDQPAEGRAEVVQQRQRQVREKTEKRAHAGAV